MFKIDMQKLRTADSSHLFWMDLTMLILVFINLSYLFLDFYFNFHFQFVHCLFVHFISWLVCSECFPSCFSLRLNFCRYIYYRINLQMDSVFTEKNMTTGGFILCTLVWCNYVHPNFKWVEFLWSSTLIWFSLSATALGRIWPNENVCF